MADKKKNNQYWNGVGRRKTAIARVRIITGDKIFEINNKKAEPIDELISPLVIVGEKDSFGMTAKVTGGGTESRKEAIRLGIARALEKYNPEFRTTLKKAGFLTRDPREKERKKPGLKGARRAPQWSKR